MDSPEFCTHVFFLTPDYPMVPLTSAIEVLATANRILGRQEYHWKFASLYGEPVEAANKIDSSVHYSLSELRTAAMTTARPKAVIVCAGEFVERYENPSLFAGLREFSRQGILVGGLSTGAHLLAAAKLLENRSCVVHWEILPQFSERFPNVRVKSELYEIDDKFCTCAGGLAAIDMMLTLVEQEQGADAVKDICDILTTDRMREPTQRQRLLKIRSYVPGTRIEHAIKLMEANISDPLPIDEIAQLSGVTRRQVERWFQRDLDCPPAKHYLDLRLQHAYHLLNNSRKSVTEIAMAAGFSNTAYFSLAFKKKFGTSPRSTRLSK